MTDAYNVRADQAIEKTHQGIYIRYIHTHTKKSKKKKKKREREREREREK